MDRKYSDPTIWDNSIDHDDEPDGSDGGYTKHGSFIVAPAMRELVRLRAELAECKRDAELWRAYQARKQAVIDAGMASNPMRAVAANMCPVCHSMIGAPHELWCRHSALAAKGEKNDV